MKPGITCTGKSFVKVKKDIQTYEKLRCKTTAKNRVRSVVLNVGLKKDRDPSKLIKSIKIIVKKTNAAQCMPEECQSVR